MAEKSGKSLHVWPCPGKCSQPQKLKLGNNVLSKIGEGHRRGGITKVVHPDTTSKVLLCRMVKTRGGKVSRPVAPPRVYMQPNGVKVRRMDGGIRYQPPSLKCITTILLDQIHPHPTPNVHLYQSVQRVIDKLRNFVEDKIMGLETPGTQNFGVQVDNYFCF